ncbi:PD-(D/E)XK nuclease family protein [Butyrivibrio sp. MC2013]|uniref:PD-(D/E)XK nuclease family protein n=1 Tax=Butyrivibrio sp. MC2013 TaxID=1280686 RepID=UPI0005688073|nr:PD-(D/E)XK nuclease family protein [Butyrivibrio sp. MC2013]
MLRFIFGPSGSGKSRFLYSDMIKRSVEEASRRFFIIVPDQFTMQTQMDIVRLHPDKGMMNIDVLSFGRLSHRIFEETGEKREQTLDDLGKSLILRHVAGLHVDELPLIGPHMHKPGYIDEVKSTISEFMQYDISPDDIDRLIEVSQGRGALVARLKDLKILYREFLKYIKDKYTTSEETMSILCERLKHSELIKDSVIAFDGFTGFTPIQYRVIGRLMERAAEVTVTLDMGRDDDPYEEEIGDQDLFALSKKTVLSLERTLWKSDRERDPSYTPDFPIWRQHRRSTVNEIFMDKMGIPVRYENNPSLDFLEKNLYSYEKHTYTGDLKNDKGQESIVIASCMSIDEEVRSALIHISDLVRKDSSLMYKDFAIVCGDPQSYFDRIRKRAGDFEIPVYIDETRQIRLSPFIEFIRSSLEIVRTDYSFDSLFHYLRCGMADISRDQADRFENYVRALGIRGRKAYENIFTRHLSGRYDHNLTDDEREAYLQEMNDIRARIAASFKPLFDHCEGNVLDKCKGLYEFIVNAGCAGKLEALAAQFEQNGHGARAAAYRQIYKKVMDLLDQLASLLGDEVIELRDFEDILDAGFGEIEVGTIPGSVDTVRVGDMERSRLSDIRYLIFLGVNDSNIPKKADSGGFISGPDREYLAEQSLGFEMAPTSRQQIYIQRLYLYMNLTRPLDQLYMSYSAISADGSSLGPAYLIARVEALFPYLVPRQISGDEIDRILTVDDAMSKAGPMIREYAEGLMKGERQDQFLTLYRLLCRENRDLAHKLKESAFISYKHSPLADSLAAALYGSVITNSVSRLELFASCCYAHFVRYGLKLDERNEYEFDISDLGSVFHESLEKFAGKVEKEGLSLMDFTDEKGEEILDKVMEEVAVGYGDNILTSSARGRAGLERIRRILLTTVKSLRYQLTQGSFIPSGFEVDFHEAGNIDEINIALTDKEKKKIEKRMRLTGKIDRIDLAKDELGRVYVKVIDYKSGGKNIDLAAVYYGLQLQLVLYMNVASAMERAKNPGTEVLPASVLYYRISDPVLKTDTIDMTPEEIERKIRKEMRMKGLVIDDSTVLGLIDTKLQNKSSESDVVPLKTKKDGNLSSNAYSIARDDFNSVSDYVGKKIREFGKRIMDGDIEVSPYEMKTKNACAYCSFRSVCAYDPSVKGYESRSLVKLDKDEALEKIKNS